MSIDLCSCLCWGYYFSYVCFHCRLVITTIIIAIAGVFMYCRRLFTALFFWSFQLRMHLLLHAFVGCQHTLCCPLACCSSAILYRYLQAFICICIYHHTNLLQYLQNILFFSWFVASRFGAFRSNLFVLALMGLYPSPFYLRHVPYDQLVLDGFFVPLPNSKRLCDSSFVVVPFLLYAQIKHQLFVLLDLIQYQLTSWG